jgi:hypothetical protein
LVCCEALAGQLLEHVVQHKVGAAHQQLLLLLRVATAACCCVTAAAATGREPSQEVVEEVGPLLWEVKASCLGHHHSHLHGNLCAGCTDRQCATGATRVREQAATAPGTAPLLPLSTLLRWA